MKQPLFLVLFSFSVLMTACTGQMPVVDKLTAPSDPCETIDRKMMQLDEFTQVVKTSSAFHLEEKASALPSPGFSVSNNRKQMLRDAEKKRAELMAERQKQGCKTPIISADGSQAAENVSFSSNPCDALDRKMQRLDEFTQVVKTSSAFHLEEKASALPSPGFSVSNNRKQMLRDAEKKRAELMAERHKQGCKTPIITTSAVQQVAEKTAVVEKPSVLSEPIVTIEKEVTKPEISPTTVNHTKSVVTEEKRAAQPAAKIAVNDTKEQTHRVEKKKDRLVLSEIQKQEDKTSMSAVMPQAAEKKVVKDKLFVSSEVCSDIEKELIELDQFTTMVENTSAFHLEEKISALPSPGFTVSSNKKKMLRDAAKKRATLMAEHKKAGCEPITAR